MSYVDDIIEALKLAPTDTLAQVGEVLSIAERPAPSRDDLGTIRVYTAAGTRYVKISPNQWISLDSDRNYPPTVHSDRDVVYTDLVTPRKLRSCVDAEGDPWQEVEPDRFVFGDPDEAARRFSNNSQIGRTEAYLNDAYGPLVFE